MDSSLRKEIIEKFRRNLNDSYVIVKIGDLRELIPDLNELIKIRPESPKLIPVKTKEKKIVEDDEIITLSELEQRLIKAALEKTSGNVEMASQELGISERTLWRKFEEYKIDYKIYLCKKN